MGGLYNSLFLSMNCDLLDKLHISMMLYLQRSIWSIQYSLSMKYGSLAVYYLYRSKCLQFPVKLSTISILLNFGDVLGFSRDGIMSLPLVACFELVC